MLALIHAAAQVVQLQVHDAPHLVLGQALVVDDLVQTVEELGAELALEQGVDLMLCLVAQLVGAVGAALLQIVQVRPWLSVMRPSASTCSRMLKTSGWAFSTSSNSTTL